MKKYNIGFIKLGLKTYFKQEKESVQGSNHELIDVFNIFKEQNNNCFMVSNSDIYEPIEDLSNLDYLFVFNGFAPKTLNDTNMNMLKQPLEMIKKINSFKGKVVYFWTDVRYNPKLLPIKKEIIILSQEPEYYAHLDKLIMYRKKIRPIVEKVINFAILMNWTESKRSKNAVILCNNVKKYDPIIIGNWKKKLNEFLTHPVDAKDVESVLDGIKYSWNQTTDSNWTSQKFWEMIMSNVICFHFNSDMSKLLIPDKLRVNHIDEVIKNIEKFEIDNKEYNEIIQWQQNMLIPEYFNGDFMYEIICNKINI